MIRWEESIARRMRHPVCMAILLLQCVGRMAVAETERGQPEIVLYESPPAVSFSADELLEKSAAYLSEHGDNRPAYFDVVYRDDPNMTRRLEYAGMLKAKARDEKSLTLLDEAIKQYQIAAAEHPNNTSAYEGLAHAYVQRAWLLLDTWAEDHRKAIEAVDKSILLLPEQAAERRELQEWRAMLVDNSTMKPIRRKRPDPMSRLTGESPSEYGMDPNMDINEFNQLVYNPQPLREEVQQRLAVLRQSAMETDATTSNKLAYAGELLRVGERTRQGDVLKEAQDVLSGVLSSESDNVEALCGMARYNSITRNYAKALELLNMAHAVNPKADSIGAVVAEMVYWRHMYQRFSRLEDASPEFRRVNQKAFEKLDRVLSDSELPFVRYHVEHTRIEEHTRDPDI